MNATETKVELLPCPFCEHVEVSEINEAIECSWCGARGPESNDFRSTWNVRLYLAPQHQSAIESAKDALRLAILNLKSAQRHGLGQGGAIERCNAALAKLEGK